MNRGVKIVLAAAGLLVAAVASIPFLIRANTFRPLLERQLTATLGRQVRLGDVSLSILSGSLVARDLSIADEPKYGVRPFLTARRLRIAVAMRPLIFSRQLQIRSFAAAAPEIHLVRDTNGAWNFSSIGWNAAGGTEKARQNPASAAPPVSLITIEDGRALVETAPAEGQPLVCEHLNLSVRQFSFAKQFSFTISASLPGGGAVTVTGSAGPINQKDAAMTALDAQVLVKHLEPVTAGLLDPSVGISMLADIDAQATSDGQTFASNGKLHMEHLQLRKRGKSVLNPVDLYYHLTHGLRDNSGHMQDATVNMGNVAIHMGGTYQLRTGDPLVNLKLTGQKLPIDELQALLTAAGVKLPNGAVMKGGMLGVALGITGPANALLVTGPVELNNTQMVGFDLSSKIHGIAALSGLKTGDTTNIEKLRLKLRVTNAGSQLTDIYALIPAVGELTGSGTVSSLSELNLRLIVKVTTAGGLGKAGVGLLTKLNEFAGSSEKSAVAKGVPMLVTGTVNDPVITADVRGLLHRDKAALFEHLERKK